jgi:hypothetical protein
MQHLNNIELLQAIEWLKECADCGIWIDMDADGIDDLSDAEIERAVMRNFDGGIESFKAACIGSFLVA